MPFCKWEANVLASSPDERIVARQIGRNPKPFVDVCRRCRYDYPQVILNSPAVKRSPGKTGGSRGERGQAYDAEAGTHWEVFPTIHWLTCPLLHRAISRLEAEGQIRAYEERLQEDEQFYSEMEAEHAAAASARIELVPEQVRHALQNNQPRQWQSLAETGVAGIRGSEGVKCLHAHYADFIGRGTNPIGKEVDEQLRRRGIAVDGDDECWRHCTVDESVADAERYGDRILTAARARHNGASR